MVVPIFPCVQKFQGVLGTKVTKNGFFQMATVIYCYRMYLSPGNCDPIRLTELTSPRDSRRILSSSRFTSKTNCLQLDLVQLYRLTLESWQVGEWKMTATLYEVCGNAMETVQLLPISNEVV